jgi:hypothetical protein
VLSRETVRGQIKAVFGKAGVYRQNELAALIARIQLRGQRFAPASGSCRPQVEVRFSP